MTRHRIRLTLLSVALGVCSLLAQPLRADGMGSVSLVTPEPLSVVLVELFTSEGCSSCPPADALLRQINGTTTEAGQLIVGISEHVTYWNSLGWADPYSSETYTARQNGYGERFHLESVYTPQMVINGAEQIVGSNQAGLAAALEKESRRPRASTLSLHILSANVRGGMLSIGFSAGGAVTGQAVEIIAVLADDVDRSSVLRGENSGRTLAHVAVARSIVQVATLHGNAEKAVEVPLPAGFQATPGHHLVLFAQGAGLGQVLAVATKPL